MGGGIEKYDYSRFRYSAVPSLISRAIALFAFPVYPWGDGCWINPQAFLPSRAYFPNLRERHPPALLPIPRAPAVFEERVIQVHAIGQDHVPKGGLVPVVAVGAWMSTYTHDVIHPNQEPH